MSNPPTLSPKALEILRQLFAPESGLQIPAGLAEQVIEIRAWVAAQIVVETPDD